MWLTKTQVAQAARRLCNSDAQLGFFKFGRIEAGDTLEIVSHMPQNGVIFSDGVEDDFLEFNSGAIARIGLAEKKAHLVVHTPRALARAMDTP